MPVVDLRNRFQGRQANPEADVKMSEHHVASCSKSLCCTELIYRGELM